MAIAFLCCTAFAEKTCCFSKFLNWRDSVSDVKVKVVDNVKEDYDVIENWGYSRLLYKLYSVICCALVIQFINYIDLQWRAQK